MFFLGFLENIDIILQICYYLGTKAVLRDADITPAAAA